MSPNVSKCLRNVFGLIWNWCIWWISIQQSFDFHYLLLECSKIFTIMMSKRMTQTYFSNFGVGSSCQWYHRQYIINYVWVVRSLTLSLQLKGVGIPRLAQQWVLSNCINMIVNHNLLIHCLYGPWISSWIQGLICFSGKLTVCGPQTALFSLRSIYLRIVYGICLGIGQVVHK